MGGQIPSRHVCTPPSSTYERSVNLTLARAAIGDQVPAAREREFFIDNLLVQIRLIIEMILVDRRCTMGV